MELKAITPGSNGKTPTSGIPLTPTIRLSEPPTPQHGGRNDYSDVGGMDNPVFVGDEEPLFSKSYKARDRVSTGMTEPFGDNASAFSGSNDRPVTNGGMSNTSSLSNGDSHLLNGTVRTRHNTMSLTDMLMPPNFKTSQKRHSLPTNGVSLSSSNGDSLSIENGSASFLGSSCASIMSQVSSPMKGLSSPWKKWFHRKSSDGSMISSVSDGSLFSNSLDPDESSIQSKQRLQDLVKSVARKVRRKHTNKVEPFQGSTPNLLAPPEPHGKPATNRGNGNIRKRLDSFAPSSILDQADTARLRGLSMKKFAWRSCVPRAIDPTGNFWLAWLFIVSMAFIYNAVVIFLRGTFSYVQGSSVPVAWLTFDYLCDFIYIVDMVLRAHLSFFSGGQLEMDFSVTRRTYLKSKNFLYDLASLLPLDLFYIITGVQPLLRIPRLLKVHVCIEFSSKFENKIRMAFIFRTVRMVGYLLYMIHLNTCCYYAMAIVYGINGTEWLYGGEGDPYVRCLYRATKTLITIGNLPEPTTNAEILFMTIDFMVGIFVFATIIGQMRDIVGSASATKQQFRERMDATMNILKNRKIPENVQNRVHLWFMYSLDKGELLDEQKVLQAMPIKMQTDMAIHVHMDTLSKVSLFQDCDKMLLRDLVLQLRPVLFLPGDYICKKGEVGKEMYIIKNGMVQVLGGEDGKKVLATLHAGSVFGEISLLSLGAGNRRTADVYSPGYSDLFVLDKKVLQEVIVSYPDAQEILKKKAREILKQNDSNNGVKKKKRGKSLIAESILTKNVNNTPSKFFKAVLEVARSKHISATILKGSFDSSQNEEEKEFFHYSSSDISGDEFLPVERGSFRKRTKRGKKVLDNPPVFNGDSGSDTRRSDVDAQEPAIVIHPSPKHQTETQILTDDVNVSSVTNLPTTSNSLRAGGPLGLSSNQTPAVVFQGTTSAEPLVITNEVSGKDENMDAKDDFHSTKLPSTSGARDGTKLKRKKGVVAKEPLTIESNKLQLNENSDSEEDPGDFHFNTDVIRQSPNISVGKMESFEDVRSDQLETHFLPSLPKGTSILTAASDNTKELSYEEYRAAHKVYDIEDLDISPAEEDKETSKGTTTSQESLIPRSETKQKRKTPSPKKKYTGIKGKPSKGKKEK
ncbi:Cyclic nucleotide-gated cation channel beta-1 [Holothuria leucospilota]|uniref:Cyclic nucleotide-gated cation channel beta-1 n=1 Tax=Holothuria leucospilota TaxID=206669 RepID=A0A9Q1CBE1_HOLLE|nr:Cyclic nucleotide-gated cation channel beta-1 [Holothuria leucospilota]